MNQTIEIAWTTPNARKRRLRFEPRATGGHTRIEQELRAGEWHTVGQEIVADVGLEAPAAIVGQGVGQ